MNNITVYQGDITKLSVDAIVNAANKSLLGGGGDGKYLFDIRMENELPEYLQYDFGLTEE